ncbi:MAG: OmpH family outer membrane protein [Acidobacteriota bacterium]|nr:OmpH family outer membrane protein [Acidobacteriota bacterium]
MKRLFFALLMTSALLPSSLGQDNKPMVVVINVDRVYLVCNMGQQLAAKLDKFTKDAQKEGRPLADKAQQLQQKLTTDNTLSPEDRGKMQRELESLAIEIKRFNDDKKRQAQIMQDEGLKAIEEKLKPVLADMAKSQGWDVLLNKVPNIVIMAGPAADVTDKVIEEFNKVTGS